MSYLYSPELEVGFSPVCTFFQSNKRATWLIALKRAQACCSDHQVSQSCSSLEFRILLTQSLQSFWENGFAASQLFERAGPIADPMYHNSGDLSEREGYDLEQLRSIAKVQVRIMYLCEFTPGCSCFAKLACDSVACGWVRPPEVELGFLGFRYRVMPVSSPYFCTCTRDQSSHPRLDKVAFGIQHAR